MVSEEIRTALDERRPVVALESTIFSRLGLPEPQNREAYERVTGALRSAGVVPALTCVLDGRPRIGVSDEELERILACERKCGATDLSVAIGQGWDVGATTVGSTVTLASLAGIEVFATGGIGGVHRDVTETGDISNDLDVLAREPVVTVTAGAKAFLDLRRTLEYLETVGVPVLGWRTDRFPAFYVRDSGLDVPHRVETADEVARIRHAAEALRRRHAIVVAVPIPEADALDADVVENAVDLAMENAADEGIGGVDVTPYVLAAIGQATGGRSVAANLALAENNARVAAEIATALCAG